MQETILLFAVDVNRALCKLDITGTCYVYWTAGAKCQTKLLDI